MRAFIALCVIAIAGCRIPALPAGTQIQSSTFGLKVSPQAPDGTPLVVGSHTTIITTPQPADAGPNLNRFEGRAGIGGANVKSTVASGPVGEQLRIAGGAAAVLHPPDTPVSQQAGVPQSSALPSAPATQLGDSVADE